MSGETIDNSFYGSAATKEPKPNRQGRLQQVQELKGHGNANVRSVAFSPDGHRLASGGWGSKLLIWEADRQGRLQQVKGHGTDSTDGAVCSVAFSSDGHRLASGGGRGKLLIWKADK